MVEFLKYCVLNAFTICEFQFFPPFFFQSCDFKGIYHFGTTQFNKYFFVEIKVIWLVQISQYQSLFLSPIFSLLGWAVILSAFYHRLAKGGFFSESAIRFSDLQI